jgi:hypothetical protein
MKPKLRTPEEIMAKYRKAGVISCDQLVSSIITSVPMDFLV